MGSHRTPFLCRTNLHHHWEWATTTDGVDYERCARCLKERGGPLDDRRTVGSTVVTNFGSTH